MQGQGIGANERAAGSRIKYLGLSCRLHAHMYAAAGTFALMNRKIGCRNASK